MIILASPQGCFVLPAGKAREIRLGMPAYFSEFMRPLAAPAEGDLIDVIAIVDPATEFPKQLKHQRRPTVVLVGDDPGAPEGCGGADAWQCATKLSRWTRAVIVNAAGGEAKHYAEATRAALKVGRVAMIETTSANARGWVEKMKCRRTLLILPRDGLHPLPNLETFH